MKSDKEINFLALKNISLKRLIGELNELNNEVKRLI